MAKLIGRCLLLVGGMLGLCLGARAQSKETDPLHLAISAGASYTDNRDSTSKDMAENNVDLSISPEIEYSFFGDASVLSLRYQPEYRWRNNPSDIQNTSELYHDLLVSIDHKQPQTNWHLQDQFDRTDDPAVQSGGATLSRDSSFNLNRVNGELDEEITQLTQIGLQGRDEVKSYDDAQRALESDENDAGGTLTIAHKLSPDTLIAALVDGANYGYKSSDYNRDFQSVMFGGGLDRIFTPDFRGGLRAGVQSLSYKDSRLASDTRPFAKIAVTAGQAPALRVNAYVNYAVENSDVYPFSSEESKELYALVEWNPDGGSGTILGLAATARTGTFSQDQLPAGGAAYQNELGFASSGDKKTMVVEASLTHNMDESTSLKLTQRLEDVTSDVSVDYTRNSTTLILTHQF